MTCSSCGNATATDYDPMGTYQPEIRMDAARFLGYEKDGTPVYSMAESADPINLIGTVAFIAAGAALGWLMTGTVIGYLGAKQ